MRVRIYINFELRVRIILESNCNRVFSHVPIPLDPECPGARLLYEPDSKTTLEPIETSSIQLNIELVDIDAISLFANNKMYALIAEKSKTQTL